MRQFKISKSFTNRSEESLDKYLLEISRVPMITTEEEVVLAQAIHAGGKKGEEAKEKLVTANLRFVVSVAKQYQHQGVPLIDLINEGNLGLITAADKFDETRGFKFISYAIWWIRQSIRCQLAARRTHGHRRTGSTEHKILQYAYGITVVRKSEYAGTEHPHRP